MGAEIANFLNEEHIRLITMARRGEPLDRYGPNWDLKISVKKFLEELAKVEQPIASGLPVRCLENETRSQLKLICDKKSVHSDDPDMLSIKQLYFAMHKQCDSLREQSSCWLKIEQHVKDCTAKTQAEWGSWLESGNLLINELHGKALPKEVLYVERVLKKLHDDGVKNA